MSTRRLSYNESIHDFINEMMTVQNFIGLIEDEKESTDSLLALLHKFHILEDKYKFYDFLNLLRYSALLKSKNIINDILLSIKDQIIETFTKKEIYFIFGIKIIQLLYPTSSNNSTKSENESSEKVDIIAKIIRSDDIDMFTSYISRTNMPLDSNVSDSSIKFYQYFCDSLIVYSAAFGSINIFKFLFNKINTFPHGILSAAVFGGNYEIIHLLESKNIKPDNCVISQTIPFIKNELFDYFISNYPIELNFNLVVDALRSQNYYVLNEIFDKNPEFLTNINHLSELFSYTCIYDIRSLFNILYQIPDIDVNIQLDIFFSFFLKNEVLLFFENGNTPLHFAACNNYLYIVNKLLKHPKINVNSVDAVL